MITPIYHKIVKNLFEIFTNSLSLINNHITTSIIKFINKKYECINHNKNQNSVADLNISKHFSVKFCIYQQLSYLWSRENITNLSIYLDLNIKNRFFFYYFHYFLIFTVIYMTSRRGPDSPNQ